MKEWSDIGRMISVISWTTSKPHLSELHCWNPNNYSTDIVKLEKGWVLKIILRKILEWVLGNKFD